MALALSHLAAAEQHGAVLSYQCSDLYRSSALYPILDRLRRDARIRHLDRPEMQIAKLRKLLRDRVDTPAVDDDLCRYLLDIEVSSAENRRREDLRENAFQLMIKRLKRMTASRPYLLVIEDLQWIDPTSRELLEAIVQLATEMSLFVLVTSRPGPAEESMIAAIRIKPNVAIYRLGPLSDELSSAIITNAFEGIHCPPSVTAAILKRTEPDRLPFYLEELAHFVRDKLTAQGDQWSEATLCKRSVAQYPSTLRCSCASFWIDFRHRPRSSCKSPLRWARSFRTTCYRASAVLNRKISSLPSSSCRVTLHPRIR